MLLGSIWESATSLLWTIYNVIRKLEQVPKGIVQKQGKGKWQ